MASGSALLPTAGTAPLHCGFRTAGTGSGASTSRRRNTGTKWSNSPTPVGRCATRGRQSRTFPITKPTPTRHGPGPGYPPNLNGRRSPRRTILPQAISSTAPARRCRGAAPDCSAIAGNGPARPICHTRASPPPTERSANTTASSCRASSCCAARAVPRRAAIRAPATATSSTPISAGSSPDCAWRKTSDVAAGEALALVNLDEDGVDRDFRADVLAGLSQPHKAVPARWLYDDAGSALFERITRLPEYYPTRAETEILTDRCG